MPTIKTQVKTQCAPWPLSARGVGKRRRWASLRYRARAWLAGGDGMRDDLAGGGGGLDHMTVDILGKATFRIRVNPSIKRCNLLRQIRLT